MLKIVDSPLFNRLRQLFNGTLDATWFPLIATQSQLDLSGIRQLRDFLSDTKHLSSYKELLEKLAELEKIIFKVRDLVLPYLKEYLQISPLNPSPAALDHEEVLLRRCIAYTLPYNLAELLALIAIIRENLPNELALAASLPILAQSHI